MKNLLILFLTLCTSQIIAQEKTNTPLGYFADVSYNSLYIKDNQAHQFGINSGVNIGNFYLGMFGNILDDSNFYINSSSDYKFDVNQVGVIGGVSIPMQEDIYFDLNGLMGLGNMALNPIYESMESQLSVNEEHLVYALEVSLVYQLTNFMRISTNVGYRMISEFENMEEMSASDFTGVKGGVTLRFGKFTN